MKDAGAAAGGTRPVTSAKHDSAPTVCDGYQRYSIINPIACYLVHALKHSMVVHGLGRIQLATQDLIARPEQGSIVAKDREKVVGVSIVAKPAQHVKADIPTKDLFEIGNTTSQQVNAYCQGRCNTITQPSPCADAPSSKGRLTGREVVPDQG